MNIKRSAFYRLSSDRKTLDFLSNRVLLEGLNLTELEKGGIVLPTHIVKQDEIFRPDILARRMYGDDCQDYYSIVLRLNGIIDPCNDLYIGMRIKYVPKSVLEEFIGRSKLNRSK